METPPAIPIYSELCSTEESDTAKESPTEVELSDATTGMEHLYCDTTVMHVQVPGEREHENRSLAHERPDIPEDSEQYLVNLSLHANQYESQDTCRDGNAAPSGQTEAFGDALNDTPANHGSHLQSCCGRQVTSVMVIDMEMDVVNYHSGVFPVQADTSTSGHINTFISFIPPVVNDHSGATPVLTVQQERLSMVLNEPPRYEDVVPPGTVPVIPKQLQDGTGEQNSSRYGQWNEVM